MYYVQESILKAKYDMGMYQNVSFCGGLNVSKWWFMRELGWKTILNALISRQIEELKQFQEISHSRRLDEEIRRKTYDNINEVDPNGYH